MTVAWKENWEETKQHFVEWWNHEGLVVGMWGSRPLAAPREAVAPVGEASSVEYGYSTPAFRAASSHYGLAHARFPLDTLPMPEVNIGPGSLALLLGCEPGFSRETVWFKPCIDPANPEGHPALRIDPRNKWLRIHEETLREGMRLGKGKYLVGCPDLIENIDILAAMRDPQTLLMDLMERPEWVEKMVWQINDAFFAAYQRIYDTIKLPDGSSCFDAFRLWGPGKVAKVQCDACAMFGPEMFSRFVAPALTAQCEWLDHSMYHLDGHQCIPNLDILLGIEPLDAIEWTPDPQVPTGGNAHWYPFYRRILDAGKSVQAIGVKAHEVEPLLDAVGPKGMYVIVDVGSDAEEQMVVKAVEKFR
jgi:hypothetical protein